MIPASTRRPAYFGEALARRAANAPAAAAILSGDQVVDFATLHRAVLAQADAFHRAGVRHGAAVGLAMRDSPAHIAALFALQRLGAASFLLAPDDRPDIRDALIGQADARFVIGAEADRVGWPVPFLAIGAKGDPRAALPPPPGPDDVCGFRRSSGTTSGVPRLAPVTHRYELTQFEMLWRLVPRGPGDRYLSIISCAFEFARVTMQRALLSGAAVILPSHLGTVGDLARLALRHRATWTLTTPTHLRRLLAHGLPQPLLPGVGIVTSSAVLTEAERAQVMAQLSPELYVVYATNEIGLLSVALPDDLRRIPETVGQPMAAIRLEVVDGEGRKVPPGTVGEIRASHPDYATAYAAGTAGPSSRFADGWFYPGDLGSLDDDGYLFLKGRTDDVINVGGQKVYPTEIVECLTTHPAVAEAAVIGVPARTLGERALAAVVLHHPVPEETLLGLCVARLGRDRAPGRVIPLDALPKSAAGKIDRVELRRRIAAHVAG